MKKNHTGAENPSSLYSSLKILLPYLRRYRSQYIIGLSCVVVGSIIMLSIPMVLQRGIDAIAQNLPVLLPLMKNSESYKNVNFILLKWSATIVGLSLLASLFRYLMRKLTISASRYIEFDLRNDLVQHLCRLPQSFYGGWSTGDIMSRATNDLSAVREMLGPGMMYPVNTLSTLIISFSLMSSIHFGLALAVMLPFFLSSAFVQFFGRRVHKIFGKVQAGYADLSTKTQENLAGIRVTKAFGQEKSEIRSFLKINQEYMRRNMKLGRIQGLFFPTITLMAGLSYVIILYYGGKEVISNKISLGQFVAFLSYMGLMTFPMIALGWTVNIIQQGAASLARIQQIFDVKTEEIQQPIEISSLAVNIPIKPLAVKYSTNYEIQFENVTFYYPNQNYPALVDVSFSIPEGSWVSVTGSTGSGKSTLLLLLLRFWDPQRGKILIGGVDIKNFSLPESGSTAGNVRNLMGLVTQNPFLFSDTLAYNITFGLPKYNPEKLQQAIDFSQLRADLEQFRMGVDTLIGERGITLSGGQKQRTALARAWITNPPILLLDDVFSNIDVSTEERILSTLKENRIQTKQSLLMVSHRPSTIQEADSILVLDQGILVESGTHQDLLVKGGLYKGLFEKWLLQDTLSREN